MAYLSPIAKENHTGPQQRLLMSDVIVSLSLFTVISSAHLIIAHRSHISGQLFAWSSVPNILIRAVLNHISEVSTKLVSDGLLLHYQEFSISTTVSFMPLLRYPIFLACTIPPWFYICRKMWTVILWIKSCAQCSSTQSASTIGANWKCYAISLMYIRQIMKWDYILFFCIGFIFLM